MIIIFHQRKVLSFASVLILVFHSSYGPAHDTHYTENNPRHQPKQYINKSFHDSKQYQSSKISSVNIVKKGDRVECPYSDTGLSLKNRRYP